jgi:SgrR family transcriptional regulator
MATSRLQHQFIRLWQSFQGKSAETTLADLAETLSCSRRHVRTLLKRYAATRMVTLAGRVWTW